MMPSMARQSLSVGAPSTPKAVEQTLFGMSVLDPLTLTDIDDVYHDVPADEFDFASGAGVSDLDSLTRLTWDGIFSGKRKATTARHAHLRTSAAPADGVKKLPFQREKVYRRRHPPADWTVAETQLLAQGVKTYGEKNWKAVAATVGTRTNTQCRQKWVASCRPGIRKGSWSKQENRVLIDLAKRNAQPCFRELARTKLRGRTVSSIRERWRNHYDTNTNFEPFTAAECTAVVHYHNAGLGWARIADKMLHRTASQVRALAVVGCCLLLERRGAPQLAHTRSPGLAVARHAHTPCRRAHKDEHTHAHTCLSASAFFEIQRVAWDLPCAVTCVLAAHRFERGTNDIKERHNVCRSKHGNHSVQSAKSNANNAQLPATITVRRRLLPQSRSIESENSGFLARQRKTYACVM